MLFKPRVAEAKKATIFLCFFINLLFQRFANSKPCAWACTSVYLSPVVFIFYLKKNIKKANSMKYYLYYLC